MSHIQTGFYPDFKSYDTILISVDIEGLLEMENIFIQLSLGVPVIDFLKIQSLDKKFRVDIKAYVDINNLGLKKMGKGKFEWRLTKSKWLQLKEKTTALYRISSSGHQYLDSDIEDINSDSLQVILAFNEYPISFWKEHFESYN